MKIDISGLPPGEGKVFGRDDETFNVAVYRGDDGRPVVLSTVCPHAHCHVDWNPKDKTWDCPCHGSRFKPDGRLLRGPAIAPLTRISSTETDGELDIPDGGV